MNINEFIFSRTQPQKKIDTINALTEGELLSIREETVKRIVKDTGRRIWKTRDKRLRISQERRAGNAWNSSIDEVQLIKGKLHLEVYLQYENTDTSTSEEYDEFFRNGNYRGEVRRLDRHGNGRTYYFMYNHSDKASVMKSILLEYVFTKYAAKLTQQAA